MTEIGEEIHTKIVGVTFGNRYMLIRNLVEGESLELVREPENPHDGNAVAVMKGKDHLGYIGRELACDLAREMDGGCSFTAFVASVTGGGFDISSGKRRHGANVRIKRLGGKEEQSSRFRGRR